MEDDVAIKVEHVSKNFVLPHEKVNSVKSAFTGFYRKRSKSIETQHALHDISFEIKKGEFFGIVGRNGSGKSTMLKILASIYQPTKGKVTTSGNLVPFIELGVGFNPELTGRENVFLNGAMLGFSRKEVQAMYDEIVSFAEIERFMDQKLKNYSSGMQVRLAFSMAIRAEADILLIDEVLAVGDADFQRKCFDYFRSLRKNKKTVVFVSHDMSAVREYCDRVVLIEDSKLILEGKASKVATAYTRMFIEDHVDSSDDTGSKSKRWGDGRMAYGSVITDQKKYSDKDQFIRITTVATAKELIENPILGFSIKDASDRQLIGTNTQIKKHKLPTMTAGESIEIEWEVPNVFNDGRLFVDTAIVYHDGSVVADWWDESTIFTVAREEKTPYIVAPAMSVSVKASKK